MEASFKKLYPNVSIEVEEYKDTSEYETAMKIRITGDELPDIMYLQPDMINTYKDYLAELNDLPVASDNVYFVITSYSIHYTKLYEWKFIKGN